MIQRKLYRRSTNRQQYTALNHGKEDEIKTKQAGGRNLGGGKKPGRGERKSKGRRHEPEKEGNPANIEKEKRPKSPSSRKSVWKNETTTGNAQGEKRCMAIIWDRTITQQKRAADNWVRKYLNLKRKTTLGGGGERKKGQLHY